MAAKFEYQPRIPDLSADLRAAGVPTELLFRIIALLEKRDREVEDYINALEARLTAGGL